MAEQKTFKKATLVEVDERRFLEVCYQNGFTESDVCAYLGRDWEVIGSALANGKMNQRWINALAKKFKISSSEFTKPFSATLPIRVYVSVPRMTNVFSFEDLEAFKSETMAYLSHYFREYRAKNPDLTDEEIFEIVMIMQDSKTIGEYLHMAMLSCCQCQLAVFYPLWERDPACKAEHELLADLRMPIIHFNLEPNVYLQYLGINTDEA